MGPQQIFHNIKSAVSNVFKGSSKGTELKKKEAATGKENEDAMDHKLAKRSKKFKPPTEVITITQSRTKEDIIKERGYEMKQKLGEGAFATVYKAIKTSENLVTACKVIDTKNNKRQRYSDVKHELTVLQRVRHENVIELFEHFMIEDVVYIFLEFASGGTVSDFVRKKGPLNEKIAKKLFRQMVLGIHHMHKCFIAHRDVKLGNMLLNEKGQCKVTDFGLSRVGFRKDKGIIYCNKYSGTEPYMAPEILSTKFKTRQELEKWLYDPFVADIWALGVCLYAMLNKAYLFNPEDKQMMFRNQMQVMWKFVGKVKKKLSSEAVDLVKQLLEPHVKKRITFHGVMAHPWFNTTVGEDQKS